LAQSAAYREEQREKEALAKQQVEEKRLEEAQRQAPRLRMR
jgi:hypothetical protein